MKILLLKIFRRFLISLYEYTPPEVTYSERNMMIGKVQLPLEKLITNLED